MHCLVYTQKESLLVRRHDSVGIPRFEHFWGGPLGDSGSMWSVEVDSLDVRPFGLGSRLEFAA